MEIPRMETIDPNYLCNCPYHGDTYTLRVVDEIMKTTEQFVETGTGWGDTLNYMGTTYNVPCISCEVDTERFTKSSALTQKLSNVNIYRMDSPALLNGDNVDVNKKTLFYLDAHGQFYNKDGVLITVDPIHEELTSVFARFKDPVIIIDDFKNPFGTHFSYDRLKGNAELSIDYIKNYIPSDYNVYFPLYSDITSKCLPPGWGLTGWCLITKETMSQPYLKAL
jgi:hypothetical protein